MRIYYLCPDVVPPSGGVKQLYAHVKILIENGYDAYIMHSAKDFRPQWFDSRVPIVYTCDSPHLQPEDVIVIPEGFSNAMKQLKPLSVKKVGIALNPFYIFEQMSVGENWKNFDIDWVMAGSRIIEDLVRSSMGIDNVHTVAIAVDHDMFYYEPRLKKLQVAYVDRKDMHSVLVEKIVKSKGKILNNIEFVRIENLHITEYARLLRESVIFLTTSIFEGIHWSVLEAMACGCLCIGYHAIGAKDYIVPSGDRQNFVLAENADFVDLAGKFVNLAEMIERRDGQIEVIRQNAISTAAGYSPEFEKKTVLEFWKNFFEAQSTVKRGLQPTDSFAR